MCREYTEILACIKILYFPFVGIRGGNMDYICGMNRIYASIIMRFYC